MLCTSVGTALAAVLCNIGQENTLTGELKMKNEKCKIVGVSHGLKVISNTVGRGACVKSKIVYKGCKGMVYRLEIS